MMRFTTSTAAFVLGLVASVAASPAPTSTTDDQYLTPPATFPPLGTASGGALDSTHANNAVPTGNELAVVKKPLTIHVHNKEPEAVSILYHQNAGVPAFNGHPTAGVLKAAHTTKLVAPTGYAGRIIVGKKRYNPAGSKIEPNNVNAQPNVDVSYVDGFTLPIVCSCGGKVVTGCNKPLFELGKCPQADQGPGPICHNPKQDVPYGPAAPFFAPCEAAAYTFPKDDLADMGCNTHEITCCVGAKCQPDPKQHPA